MEINKERLLNGLARQVLVEESFATLANLSDEGRVDRSKNVIVHYQRIYQDHDGQAVTEWTVPSTSGNDKYTCDVGLAVTGTLFAAAKKRWNAKEFGELFSKADVKVYCSCPDFYWAGMRHNLGPNGQVRGGKLSGNHTFPKSHGYKYEQDVVTKAPDIKDPNREHVLCKHLLGIFKRFKNNAFDIMRDARGVQTEPVNPEVEKAEKKGTKMLMKDDIKRQKVSENLRKGLTEGFVEEVTQLHKDQKLPDDEATEIVKDVVETNPPTEEVEPEVSDVIQEEKQTPEVEVEPTEIIPPDEPEEIEEGFEEPEEEKVEPEALVKDTEESEIDPNSII